MIAAREGAEGAAAGVRLAAKAAGSTRAGLARSGLAAVLAAAVPHERSELEGACTSLLRRTRAACRGASDLAAVGKQPAAATPAPAYAYAFMAEDDEARAPAQA